MRWLKKYPITADEVMHVLESIPEDNPPGTPPSEIKVGGVNDLIRRQIIKHFTNPDNMQQVLKELEV